MENECVYLVGGPADGHQLDVPEGRGHLKLVIVLKARAIVDQHARGGISGEVVASGSYDRTDWLHDGIPVYGFKPH